MNHVHACSIDIEQTLDVDLGFAGNGDDCVGHFECRFLDPEREIVTAGKLFALPGSERFQRMSRDDERDSVIQFREDSAEMTVPGVTMHEIGVDIRGVEIDAAPHRAES